MSTQTSHPGEEELDEDTKRVLDERLATFDEDCKHLRDWEQVKANALAKLKTLTRK